MKIAVIQLTTADNKKDLVKCLREQGFTWRGGSGEITYASLVDYPYLHLYEEKNITWGNNHHEEAITDYQYLHSTIYQQPKNQTDMSTTTNTPALSITKTDTVTISKKKREITITVLLDSNRVRSGYSVRNPEDKKSDPTLAKQISTGRAQSDKTNLTPDMYIGHGTDKKFILYAIAEQLFRELNSGKIEIKGIK